MSKNINAVFLMNSIRKSDSQRTICQALVDLSRRVEARQQKNKVVVKRQLIIHRNSKKKAYLETVHISMIVTDILPSKNIKFGNLQLEI
jgi:hypothetical protein